MQDDPSQAQTFIGGIKSLVGRYERRRVRIKIVEEDEALPPLDVDFAPLKVARLPESPEKPLESASMAANKRYDQMKELRGQTELALLNATLIAHLRKRKYPDHAPNLFRRLWAEEGDWLMANLNNRWLISSVITFAHHGTTEADRRAAQNLNVLFSYMKLAEFERQFSGVPARKPFVMGRRVKERLPMDMPGFALVRGDLEANFLASLWLDAEAAPNVGPLACHLLEQLNRDPRTLFRRLLLMREARIAKKDKQP